MRYGSQSLLISLTAACLASGTIAAGAKDDIPLALGTYAQKREWCALDRADPASPDNRLERAYINLSDKEINWNETSGKIIDVNITGKTIVLTTQMAAEGAEQAVTLKLYRKSQTLFVLSGINFFYCGKHMPNPRIGR